MTQSVPGAGAKAAYFQAFFAPIAQVIRGWPYQRISCEKGVTMARWKFRVSGAVFSLLAIVSGLSTGFGGESAEGVTPADVIAAYRQTVLAYPRPRVVWRYKVTLTEAFFQSLARDAPRGKSETWEVIEDIWTDRKRVLSRMSRLPPHSPVRPPEDLVITEGDLIPKFGNCCLFVWNATQGGAYRLWHGVEADGKGRGEVGVGEVDGRVRQLRFPPLVGPSPSESRHDDWGGWIQTWHWGDAFFALNPEGMRVIGRERIGDRLLWKMEHRTVTPMEETSRRTGKRVAGATKLVAWVDLERGGLAMRLERHTELLVDGQPEPAAARMKPKPLFVGEIQEVMRTEGGRFYPKKGIDRSYHVDPRWQGQLLTAEERVAGKAVDVPVVEVSRREWEVERVDPDVAMPETTLALAFPKGTPYYDRRESRLRYEGLTDAEVAKMLAGLGPERAGQGPVSVMRRWLRWMFLACNLVALAAVGFWLYRRYKR